MREPRRRRDTTSTPRRPGTLYLYETKFAQEPVPYQDRKEPWWTRRQKRRSQKFRDAIRPEERVIPHGLRNGILVQEYHKRGRIGDMLRICRAEGRSDPLLWVLACQTTAGATRVSTASLSDGARVASKVDGVPPRRRGDAVS